MILKFYEIAQLTENDLGILLRQIDNNTLLVALCNEENIVRPKMTQIFSNEGRRVFYNDLKKLAFPNIPSLRQQQKAQKKIVAIANLLSAQGEISKPMRIKKAS